MLQKNIGRTAVLIMVGLTLAICSAYLIGMKLRNANARTNPQDTIFIQGGDLEKARETHQLEKSLFRTISYSQDTVWDVRIDTISHVDTIAVMGLSSSENHNVVTYYPVGPADVLIHIYKAPHIPQYYTRIKEDTWYILEPDGTRIYIMGFIFYKHKRSPLKRTY